MIILAGAVAIPTLPIAQFPDLAPPQIIVQSNYIGASAQVVETAVTTPLEQQINGAEGMKYLTSTSGNDGTSLITATFDPNRNPDLAAVDIQNRVSFAQGRLPNEVKQTGIVVLKSSNNFVFGAADLLGGRPLRHLLHEQLPRSLRARRAQARAGGRRRLHVRRAPVLDAAVARPYAHGEPQAHGLRRRGGAARAERAGGGGTGRPAARPAGPDLPDQRARHRPSQRGPRVREHRVEERPGRRLGAPEGRGTRRAGGRGLQLRAPVQRPRRRRASALTQLSNANALEVDRAAVAELERLSRALPARDEVPARLRRHGRGARVDPRRPDHAARGDASWSCW